MLAVLEEVQICVAMGHVGMFFERPDFFTTVHKVPKYCSVKMLVLLTISRPLQDPFNLCCANLRIQLSQKSPVFFKSFD